MALFEEVAVPLEGGYRELEVLAEVAQRFRTDIVLHGSMAQVVAELFEQRGTGSGSLFSVVPPLSDIDLFVPSGVQSEGVRGAIYAQLARAALFAWEMAAADSIPTGPSQSPLHVGGGHRVRFVGNDRFAGTASWIVFVRKDTVYYQRGVPATGTSPQLELRREFLSDEGWTPQALSDLLFLARAYPNQLDEFLHLVLESRSWRTQAHVMPQLPLVWRNRIGVDLARLLLEPDPLWMESRPLQELFERLAEESLDPMLRELLSRASQGDRRPGQGYWVLRDDSGRLRSFRLLQRTQLLPARGSAENEPKLDARSGLSTGAWRLNSSRGPRLRDPWERRLNEPSPGTVEIAWPPASGESTLSSDIVPAILRLGQSDSPQAVVIPGMLEIGATASIRVQSSDLDGISAAGTVFLLSTLTGIPGDD